MIQKLARAVAGVPHLTIVANSVPVAQLLHESGTTGQTVVLTGGVRPPSDAPVGPVAEASLHVDILFLGAHGYEARAGLTTPNLVEAETNRALVSAARRVCVLADSAKWGTIGLSTFADLRDVDIFVTDDRLSERGRSVLADIVGTLEVARP